MAQRDTLGELVGQGAQNMSAMVAAYDTAYPGDTDGLRAKLAPFSPHRIRRLALLVKTEGNSDVNDY